MLISLNKDVLLAAPTGRASQRMTEVIGKQSKTIHRLLKWDAGKSEFRKCEREPLECDFIIVDEFSMLDIKLAASLLRAVSPNTQILFVGDKDQLPSVGPGNVCRDLIESGCVDAYNLEKVFRQAEKSKIISYAHNMNKGYMPNVETPIAEPSLWSDGTDCMFIDSSMNEEKKDVQWSSLKYGLNAVDMIVKLYTEIIPKYLGKENEIQVLSPMNKGSVGTKEINRRIQEVVNPFNENKPELQVGERVFREGDRVMQTTNNYDLNVFNGDIGIIERISSTDRRCVVNFGDKKFSRQIQYERQNLIELELAYSITIHKSQGSEFGTVIIPILNQHYIMLYRNLIYTGLTRAKKMAILIGEREALDRSIKNMDPNIRQTSLQKFMKENYEHIEAELEFLD
jgi:exodeoxyribonuclease V alpha subunit